MRELQKRSILTFLCANRDGRTAREQMIEGGVLKDDAPLKECWDQYVVPVGPDSLDGIYVLNWSIRSALTFGGHKRGESRKCLDYTKRRIHAFGITFGEIPDDWYALGAGAILMGYPVISDSTTTPEIRPTGVTVREELVVETDYAAAGAHLHRHPGGEGEGREDRHSGGLCRGLRGRAGAQGRHARAVRLQVFRRRGIRPHGRRRRDPGRPDRGLPVRTSTPSPEGGAMPLAIEVLVAGRKMHRDFEGILERQIHRWLSHAMGFMHTGQRDQIWCRISKKAFQAGLRLKHLGTILHAKLHDEYGGIVDKVAVRITTEPEAVKAKIARGPRGLPHPRRPHRRHDRRVGGDVLQLHDLPELRPRPRLRDHAAAAGTVRGLQLAGRPGQLRDQPHRPQPADRQGPHHRLRQRASGKGVNKFVYQHSNHKIERFCAYSLLESPMTSCGCFECIVAVLPLANGVMVVNREYPGMTPCGMSFGDLASVTGGGAQTPGFVGVGRLYLSSPKFLAADGGVKRLVWMPKSLKEGIRERLQKRGRAARRARPAGQDRHRRECDDRGRGVRRTWKSRASGPVPGPFDLDLSQRFFARMK